MIGYHARSEFNTIIDCGSLSQILFILIVQVSRTIKRLIYSVDQSLIHSPFQMPCQAGLTRPRPHSPL